MNQRMEVSISRRMQSVTITTEQGSIEVLVADLPTSQTLAVTVKVLDGNVDVETIGAAQ